jgi:hypothetical protein
MSSRETEWNRVWNGSYKSKIEPLLKNDMFHEVSMSISRDNICKTKGKSNKQKQN